VTATSVDSTGVGRAGPQGPSARLCPAGLSFPKRVRLLKPRQFRLVQGGGRRAGGQWLAITVRVTDEGAASGSARFGMAISRKVGNAVARNHVKRRVREAARHLRSQLPAVDVVVAGRPGAGEVSGAVLREELERLLRKAGVRWNAADASQARRNDAAPAVARPPLEGPAPDERRRSRSDS
jgi:ribonuclease P protein component